MNRIDEDQDEGIARLREELDARIQAERPAPAQMAAEMAPHIRATMNYGSSGVLGGANSYMEMLVQRRDSQAAQRIPRSAAAWSAENKRPGSWMSGVGGFTAVGMGRQYPSGVGRPLIQQRES